MKMLFNFKIILIQLLSYVERKIRKKPYFLLLFPSVVFLVIFFIIPNIALFISSFYSYVPGRGFIATLTMRNYIRFLTDSYYYGILLNTMLLGLVVGFSTLIIGYPLAYFIARTSSAKKGLFLALVLFPLFVNIVVRSYAWILLLCPGGLVNQFLIKFHIVQDPLALMFNYTGVFIGLTHIFTPFMVMVLVSAIQNIEEEYEEAARVLGANKFRTFCKITLPLSLPGIVSGFLLIFLMGVTAFVTPRLLGGVTIKLLPNLIYQEFMVSFNWPFGAAMAFILLIVTLLVVMTYLKVFTLKKFEN